MTLSENQVRHLYVVKDATEASAITAASGSGYLVMQDADGKPICTDKVTNIISAKITPAAKMERKTRVVKVAIAAGINSGAPVAGEDYTLRIQYRQFVAKSDEVFYHEFASAHTTSATTASQLLLELAQNLALNTKKQGMVKVAVMASTTESTTLVAPTFSASTAYAVGDVVMYNGAAYVFTDTHSAAAWNASHAAAVDSIVIEEIAQDWILGVKEQTPVFFDVTLGNVVYNGDDLVWGTVADATASLGTVIRNGKLVADMEYFFMGERGDIYRNMGWPNVLQTRYKVDPTSAYDIIDIHYAYIGDNHSVQKSEKTLTIVCPTNQNAGSSSIGSIATTVKGKVNTAMGTNL